MHNFWMMVASNAVLAMALAASVAVIARLWRNPAVLHLLWVLVLVKLFAPPLVVIPLGGLAGSPSEGEPVAMAGPMSMEPSEASLPADVEAGRVAAERGDVPVAEDLGHRFAMSQPPYGTSVGRVPWETIGAVAWLLGVAVGAAICCRRIFVFGRLLRHHATRAPQEVRDVAERLASRLGLRRCPEVLTLDATIPPVVWLAGRRPKIVLPSGLMKSISPIALESILLHELAHVRRRDGLARWLEMIATTVFWWHPVAWWARREMRLLEEQCCDAMVVRAMPRMARDYAAALVDTLDFLSTPSRVALPAGAAPWRATSLARRIEMLKRPCVGRVTAGRAALVAAIAVVPMAVALAAGSGEKDKPKPPSVEKAELMGRVAWTMMHGGRDITAVKPIEWGDPQTDEKGNRSIRCKYYATIWDREVMIMNSVFTFDSKGYPVSMKHVEGFPKPHVKRKFDTTTKNGLIELVQDFFTKNFRDVTSRNTIEWGEPVKEANGNVSIRYKYEATIWGKEVKIMNQIFTFGPDGKFVDYKNVEGFPKDKPYMPTMSIILDKDGNTTWGVKKVSAEQLVAELKRYLASTTNAKDTFFYLTADSRCPFEKVKHVKRLCRDAGIMRFSVSIGEIHAPARGDQYPPATAAPAAGKR